MGGRCQAAWLHAVPKVRGRVRSRVSAQWRWTSRRGPARPQPVVLRAAALQSLTDSARLRRSLGGRDRRQHFAEGIEAVPADERVDVGQRSRHAARQRLVPLALLARVDPHDAVREPGQAFHLLGQQRRGRRSSQPSDTITTTAPRPTPRRTQPSLNCLTRGAEARPAGPVRSRGHRRPQGDRRLRRGAVGASAGAATWRRRTPRPAVPVPRRAAGTGRRGRTAPSIPRRRRGGRPCGAAAGAAGEGSAPGRHRSVGRPAALPGDRSSTPDEARRLRRLRRFGGVTTSASIRRRRLLELVLAALVERSWPAAVRRRWRRR